MDLHDFPFDSQLIRIRFGSDLWSAAYFRLCNRTDQSLLPLFAQLVDKNLLEWETVGPGCVSEVIEVSAEDKSEASFIEYTIPVRRRPAYYMVNVFASVFLLNVLTWGMLLIEPSAIADRLSIAMTYFLALVAYQFVVNENLPKINHSTYLTFFFSANYAVVCLATLESYLVYLLDKYWPNNGIISSATIDGVCVAAVIAAHVLLMGCYIWLSRYGTPGQRQANINKLKQD
jgi:hypothetical protein